MKKNYLLIILLPFACLVQAQLGFSDRAAALGAGYSYGQSYLGGGVSFMDFDQDGWDDLTYATEAGQPVRFFRNVEGSFMEVDLGINDLFETKQVMWVDYDNDGDLDFFASSINGYNRLYANNGNMVMKDVTQGSGLYLDDRFTYGVAFGDIDNDGDLDLFITHRDVGARNQPNRLYLNEGGAFVDISETAGISDENYLSFCASFFDYDKDGDVDIYVSNDKYTKENLLYRNNGDLTFTDVSAESGAGIIIDAMSTTIGDYNGDSWPDIYVTNTTQGNYLLRNNQNGTFTNVAPELGVEFLSIAWGAEFIDADNDTDLDIYVSGMLNGGADTRLPSAFYENQNGSFSIPSGIGLEGDNRTSFANALGDFNNDGYPDILVMNDSEPNFLWENQTTNDNHYLKIKLAGLDSNSFGFGSTLELRVSGSSQYNYALCGESYLGQFSDTEFFGMGSATTAEYLKVTWPSGTVDIIQNVEADKTYMLIEGTGELIDLQLGPADEPEEEEEEEDPMDDDTTEDDTTEDDGGLPEDTGDDESSTGDNSGLSPQEQFCVRSKVFFYPNPSTDGSFEVCLRTESTQMQADVFSINGVRVLSQSVSSEDMQLDLSTLNSGLYVVKLQAGEDTHLGKVLIR